jgi:regulator of replication initiation timing
MEVDPREAFAALGELVVQLRVVRRQLEQAIHENRRLSQENETLRAGAQEPGA